MKCKNCGKEVYEVYKEKSGFWLHFEEKANNHKIVLEEKK